MPWIPRFFRRGSHPIAPAKQLRPARCKNELREPGQICVGMTIYVANRRYKMAPGFTPRQGKVTKAPYGDNGQDPCIEVKFPDATEVLKLCDYGIVEYAGGGWSQIYYLYLVSMPKSQNAA